MSSSRTAFQEWTRKVFNLIRAQHHLRHVRRALDTGQAPRGIKDTQKWLEGTIRPGLMTSETAYLLSGNAANWTQTSLQILLEHYLTLQGDLQRLLQEAPLTDWSTVWRVALRWAQRRLHSLDGQTIETVIQNLREIGIHVPIPAGMPVVGDSRSRDPEGSSQEVQVASNPVVPQPADSGGQRRPVIRAPVGETFEPDNQEEGVRVSRVTGASDISQREEQTEMEVGDVQSQILVADFIRETRNEGVGIPSTLIPKPVALSAIVTTRMAPRKSVAVTTPSQEKPLSPGTTPEIEWLGDEDSRDWDAEDPVAEVPDSTPRPQRKSRTPGVTERRLFQDPPLRTLTPPGPSRALNEDPDFSAFLRDAPKFTRHDHNGDKYNNWSLEAVRPILVLGDSNMARLPLIEDEAVQVDCFPGANLIHAAHVIRNKTSTSPGVKTVILAFGFNDRNQGKGDRLQALVDRLLKVAKDTFPYAKILIPLINCSASLKSVTRKNIDILNEILRHTNQSIPCLQQGLFKTGRDKIHWDVDTGVAMWDHWRSFLALGIPQFK